MSYSYPKEFWLNLQGRTGFKSPLPGYVGRQKASSRMVLVGVVLLLLSLLAF